MTEENKTGNSEIRTGGRSGDWVGIGNIEFQSKKMARKEEIMEAYRKLADLLKGKKLFFTDGKHG